MKPSKIDVLTGYLSQFLNIGAGLILLPFSITYLSSEEAGLWLIIITIVSSIALLDFGFSQTVTRNFSYVLAGASDLKKEGVDKPKENSQAINYLLLFSLLTVTKRIYWFLGLCSIGLLGVFGTMYIHHVIRDTTIDYYNALAVWWVYVVGITLNVVFLYFVPVLLGCGKIRSGYQVSIINRGSMLLLSIISLLLGYGLLGLAVSYFISVIISRIYSSWCFSKIENFKIGLNGKKQFDKELLSIMWHNASKLGLVMLGSFLINRSTALLAGWYLTLEEAASFNITIQIFSVLLMVSQTYFQTHVPMFSQLQLLSSKSGLRKKYVECMFVAWFVMIAGSVFFIWLGNPILSLINANVAFLSTGLLAVAAVIFFLEMNHSLAATFITTKNEVPFVRASLLSGGSVIVLSAILCGSFELGVLGLLMGQGVSQLVYNNWRWPLVAWKMIS